MARDPTLVGGNFHVRFDADTPFDRWLTGFYGWVSRHGIYYGDTGMFVRRTVYHRLGGMPDLAVMEDYAFVCRLERAGTTLHITDPPLVTSSRRFAGRRSSAIVVGWVAMHLLFHLGAPQSLLVRVYDSHRRRTPG